MYNNAFMSIYSPAFATTQYSSSLLSEYILIKWQQLVPQKCCMSNAAESTSALFMGLFKKNSTLQQMV